MPSLTLCFYFSIVVDRRVSHRVHLGFDILYIFLFFLYAKIHFCIFFSRRSRRRLKSLTSQHYTSHTEKMSESQYYQEGEHHQDNQEHHHHHEQQDEHHQHHEHHEHHDQPHHEQTHEHNDVESSGDEKPHETQPSAPSSDENGYVVVSSKPVNSSVVDEISKALLEEKDAAPSAVDVASRTPSAKVVAEADSSTHNIKSVHLTYDPKSRQAGCSMCPYYSLGK